MANDEKWQQFAASYPKEIDSVPAYRVWWTMSDQDRDQAVATAGVYADSVDNPKYVPAASKWLADRRYLDTFKPRRSPDEVTYGAPRPGDPGYQQFLDSEAAFRELEKRYAEHQQQNGAAK